MNDATDRFGLLLSRDPAAPLAWRDGVPISAAQYLADVQAQGAALPAQGPLLNLCNDLYRFAVGFGAALVRGKTSLLPPNALPATLERLGRLHPTLQILSDVPIAHAPAGQGVPVLAPCAATAADPSGRARVAAVQAAAWHEPPRIEPSLPAVCLFTSGSTGDPQPHVKTWATLVGNMAAAVQRHAPVLRRPGIDGLNLVLTVPSQHSYGLESGVLLALLGGAAFDVDRPFYPADIAVALARLPRPRALVTTPFHLHALIESGVALPPCDLVLCATAPLSADLARRAEQALRAPLVEIYGCTEAGQIATRRTASREPWQTFGGLRVRALAGAAEQFVVEGGHVPEPIVLSDLLQPLVGEGGRRFELLGRSGDLVKVAGSRSSLAHLNQQLLAIDGVLDGSFWLPDEPDDGVVRAVAFVVAPTLGAADIVAALRERVEPAFLPRRVLHVDALPREATGKLTAAALRRFAHARLDEGAP